MNQAGQPQPSILQADGISRVSSEGQWLLRNASLGIDQGDRVAVVGPSGSGKSVLLRAMVLLDPVKEGRVFWKGNRISRDQIPRFRSRIIYVHQQPQLMEGSVEENLRSPFELRIHADRSFDRDHVIELLKSVGRDESFLTKPQTNLSGGEAAIVGLVRAIQLEPEALLLDEPTAALDKTTMLQMERLVDAWFQSSSTRGLVWVSHSERQVERVANRIVRIENGTVRD